MTDRPDLIQLPSDTKARWEQFNPIINEDEAVIEKDTLRWKVGTGARYLDTPYMGGEAPTDPGAGVTQQQLTDHINSLQPHPNSFSGSSLLSRYRSRKV